MALFGLFGKGPLTEAKIDKVAKLASNPFAQPDVRMRELQRLLADGSPAAIRGALKRFAANASGAIADEDEKKWLADALVDLGEPALEPLRGYIRSETQLTYALRAYRDCTSPDEAVRFFLEVLHAYGPDEHRMIDAKLQLVLELGEQLGDPRVLPGLTAFLLDHSDDVRWAVMDLVEQGADGGQLTAETRAAACAELARLVCEADVGPRIQLRAAELLARREWQLPGEAATLAAQLADDYFLDKKRFIRRRVKLQE